MARQHWCGVLVLGSLLALIGVVATDAVLGQVKIQIGVGPGMPVAAQPLPGGPGGIAIEKKAPNLGSLAAQLSGIKIIEKSEFRQVINVARDCVKDKAWEEAVTALQALLDNKEDHYVQVRDRDAAGKETLRWTSVKFEANNLLGSMPAEGMEVYDLRYGRKAKDKLDEAKQKGDRELLAEVAQRYCHTRAGIEANELLATLFLARGQNFIAALRFEKLLAMDPERVQLKELTLYKAALAFHRAGEANAAAKVWTKLEKELQTAGGNLKVGEQTISIAKLKEVLNDDAGGDAVNPYEWPMIRGNLTNTAQATGSPPLLDTLLWKRPLLRDNREEPGKDANDLKRIGKDETQADLRVRQAIDNVRKSGLPVMSGFFPIASKGVLVYRTHTGIRAVAIKEVKDAKGRPYRPGEIVWNSIDFYAGLANLLDQNSTTRPIIEQWLTGGGQPNQPVNPGFNPGFVNPGFGMHYFHPSLPGAAGILFENSTIGTLSTDHQYVYAIDDLAVPPPFAAVQMGFGYPQMNMGEVRKFVTQNVLMAFNLDKGGKLEWDLGGKDDALFAESHFLGAPISIGGKLYVLNEKNPAANMAGGEAELRLVCIDPTKKSPQGHPAVVEPIQLLGMVQPQNRVSADVGRRTSAVHLAFGGGILVCPTNAGEVFGVDLMSRSLVWSYPYRETVHAAPFQTNFAQPFQPFPQPRIGPMAGGAPLTNWKTAPPAIAEGKVVFTAPDASSVHCINLRDGTPVWKSPQQDGDLYLAGVFGGKVLIVGKNSIRALNLQTGQRLWSISTGDLPSGQGVASKNIYYLPLSKGEILAVDIERGMLKAHNRAAGDAAKVAPGNLVFYEGCVLSLTPTEVVAYPQLAARLEEATVALKADPANLEKLTNHGELLLKDGQVQAAVDDLEQVVAKKADGALGTRAKDRLYEALTDLLHANFKATSDKYLDLYRDLCKATDNDQERQLRQAKFYRIVGEGREAQGNLVEAFQMYKDFGALPIHNAAGGVAALDDPTHKVPTHVWLRGRVSAMIAKATPEQRAPLEAKIQAEWKEVRVKKDLDATRSFVGMFDVPFAVGREARLHLAEEIIARNDKPAFLEAEMSLEQLRTPSLRADPAVGGRALAGLALLEEKKGTADAMRQAAAYYRELAQAFGKMEVRPGKTGGDLFNDLAADKRFLPYLEAPTSPWGAVKLAARKTAGPGFVANVRFSLAPQGDLTAFTQQHRLAFDPNNPINTELRLVDVATGKDLWTQNLGQVAANNNVFVHLYQQNNIGFPYNPSARHRFYQAKGHLLVCQIGVMAYCLDGDTGKVLWRFPLAEGLENHPGMVIQPAGVDADGNPEFMIFHPQMGRTQGRFVIGQIGAVEASYVALLTQKGLTVNDPLRGTLLWNKMDVAPGTRVFGDAEYIFLVESGEAGAVGAGRVLRANDGVVLDALPDFGSIYQNRVAVFGRRILAAIPGKEKVTLRLYDIVSGKDIWAKAFDGGSTVVRSDDPSLTGVVDPKGKLTVLDAASGNVVLAGSVSHGRIGLDDLKDLKEPLLLADAERFYLALNRPADAGIPGGGRTHNNFSNALRCEPVNGWVVALHRHGGTKKVGGVTQAFKSGDFAWHSNSPLAHQLVVLEQFDQMPVLLFSARYNEPINGGANGFRWRANTQSLDKRTGKLVYDAGAEDNNGSPQFSSVNVDARAGTINMVGYNVILQHYIDDGRKLPPVSASHGSGPPAPGGPLPGLPAFGPGGQVQIVGPQGAVLPNIVMPRAGGIRIQGNIRIIQNALPLAPPVAPAPVPIAPVPPPAKAP